MVFFVSCDKMDLSPIGVPTNWNFTLQVIAIMHKRGFTEHESEGSDLFLNEIEQMVVKSEDISMVSELHDFMASYCKR